MLSSFDQITYGSFIAFPYYYQFIRVKPPVISSKTHWYIIILHTRLINQQVQRSRVCILRHLKICRARPRLLSINARALLRYASWKSQRTSIANEKAWLLFHIRYHEKGCFFTPISDGFGTKKRSVCNQTSHEDGKWYSSWYI